MKKGEWVFILLSLVVFGVMYMFITREVRKLKLTHLGDGSFKADGTEQIVFEYERAEPFKISGQLDLEEMVDGDVVIVKQYFKVRREKPYKLFKTVEYKNKRKEPIVFVISKEAMYGFRITIQQIAGVFKVFQWIFYAGFTS